MQHWPVRHLTTRSISRVQGYSRTDEELIAACRAAGIDYSSCTSVTAVISGDLLSIAHLGDSKIVLGREAGGSMVGKALTQDHKPDMVEERKRIEKSGGSLALLHGGKPFIRGGDFTERCAAHSYQLNVTYVMVTCTCFAGKRKGIVPCN
jgi:hypothetical protein